MDTNDEYIRWKSDQAIAWLRYVRHEQLTAVALRDEIDTLRSMTLKGNDTTADKVRSTSNDAMVDAVQELIDLSEDYRLQLTELKRMKVDAHDRLMRLDDRRYTVVLTLYYVDGNTWQQVADKAHYEVETVMRIRTEALPYVYDVMPNEWRQMIPRAD